MMVGTRCANVPTLALLAALFLEASAFVREHSGARNGDALKREAAWSQREAKPARDKPSCGHGCTNDDDRPWSTKCNWGQCSECPECQMKCAKECMSGGPRSLGQRCKKKQCQGCSFCPWLTKQGLACGDANSTQMSAFTNDTGNLRNTDGATWFYNYKPQLAPDMIRFANKHGIEFVPMIALRNLHVYKHGEFFTLCFLTHPEISPSTAPGNLDSDVWLHREKGADKRCTVEQVVNTLKQTLDALTVRPRYLLAFNEPYDTLLPHKNMSAHEVVHLWRTYLQPAAHQLGLKLVSATSSGTVGKHGGLTRITVNTTVESTSLAHWHGEFLKMCYDHKDANPPCDIETIDAFAVHMYTCQEANWAETFDLHTGQFYVDLTQQLDHYGGYKKWNKFLKKKPLWVTETNCNNDGILPNFIKGDNSFYKRVCKILTGHSDERNQFGRGSVAWLELAPNIFRWSWWNTWNRGENPGVGETRTIGASLTDENGNLLSSGAALAKGLRQEACEEESAAAPTEAYCRVLCFADREWDWCNPDDLRLQTEICSADKCRLCRQCKVGFEEEYGCSGNMEPVDVVADDLR